MGLRGPKVGQYLSSVWSVEVGFSIDKRLGNNLAIWRNIVLNQDMDYIAFIDGGEGSGKSLGLAPQLAYFMDVERHIDARTQLCWNLDVFEKSVMSFKKGKAIILDEAGRYIDRRQCSASDNLRVRKLLWECRRRNLFVFFVMPSFYDADMSVAIWRTKHLFKVDYQIDVEAADFERGVIPDKPLKRGFAKFYDAIGKKMLYTNDHTRRNYLYPIIPDHSFTFQWPEHYVIDKEEYKVLRDEAEASFFVKKDKPDKRAIENSAVSQEFMGRVLRA